MSQLVIHNSDFIVFITQVYNKRRFKEDEFYCYSGLDQEGFEKKFISNYIGK